MSLIPSGELKVEFLRYVKEATMKRINESNSLRGVERDDDLDPFIM